MEDIIGKYLYIIIFVGIIVINILRSLKKRQPVPEHAESEENEVDDFWNQPPPPQQQPAFQVQQVQSKPKNVETIFPKNEFKKQETGRLMLTEEHNNPISVEFNDRDDARRAFIYSEIWNRKY